MDHVVSCASLVAWLEGSFRLDFPETAHDLSLTNLERRVLALERRVGGITSPPPFESASWNGMVWRLWRVRSKSARRFIVCLPDAVKENAGMLADEYTTAGLRIVVDSINTNLPELRCPREAGEDPEATAAECEGCIAAMVQKLAYISGKELQYLPHKTLSKALIYAYAGNLINNQIVRHAPPPTAPSPFDDHGSQDPGDQDDGGYQVGQGSQGDPGYYAPPQQGIPNNQCAACRFGCPDFPYANPGYNYRDGGQPNDSCAAPVTAYQANAAANAAPAGLPSPILAAPASAGVDGGDNRAVPAEPVRKRKKAPWIKRAFWGRSRPA